MSNKSVSIELDNNVEIHNAAQFNLYAVALGVKVQDRGQKPKGALVRAIQAHPEFELVNTEYLNASHATTQATANGEYGERLAKLREVRDNAIQAARDEFDRARKILRTEMGMADSDDGEKSTATPTADAYVVSAILPQMDGDKPRRTKDGSKVRFRPGPSKVTITKHQIRENSPAGERGRLSKSHILHAAAVVGKWLPVELLATDGWESVLLKNITVEDAPVAA